jgi:transposase
MRRSEPSKPRKLRVVNPRAAGIDIGARAHYVCAGEAQPVRKFTCFTADLDAMSAWLKACGVTTVAMEATGVYWIPTFQTLERDGFEVVLVNAKHFKGVPGRKSDVQDCQWLQYLHECGLVAGSFRPSDDVVVLRSYMRHRANLTTEAAQHIQRMQKALDQMNLHLHKVVSDIMGETGTAILGAILGGERDPRKLATLRNYRVRRSEADYVAALTGNWREEHLFSLRQSWDSYHHFQRQIATCDEAIARCCAALREVESLPELPAAKTPKHDTELRRALFRAVGVDLAAIDGLSPQAVLAILSEVGMDMTKWPTANHFVAWLRLCPNNRITGGRVRGSRTMPSRNRAAEILRKCAENLARSESYFGGFYRRMRARKGGPYAVVATAHKLARVFYQVLRTRLPYKDIGKDHFDRAHRERALRGVLKRLRNLGHEIDLSQLRPVTEAVR